MVKRNAFDFFVWWISPIFFVVPYGSQEFKVGCKEKEFDYDCDAGYDNWKVGWEWEWCWSEFDVFIEKRSRIKRMLDACIVYTIYI